MVPNFKLNPEHPTVKANPNGSHSVGKQYYKVGDTIVGAAFAVHTNPVAGRPALLIRVGAQEEVSPDVPGKKPFEPRTNGLVSIAFEEAPAPMGEALVKPRSDVGPNATVVARELAKIMEPAYVPKPAGAQDPAAKESAADPGGAVEQVNAVEEMVEKIGENEGDETDEKDEDEDEDDDDDGDVEEDSDDRADGQAVANVASLTADSVATPGERAMPQASKKGPSTRGKGKSKRR